MTNQLGSIAALRALSCIVFGSLVLASQQANAVPVLQLSDGATTVTVTDGGAGDLCPAANCVLYSGAVGGFTINSITGVSLAGSNVVQLDLGGVIISSGTGTLTIKLSDSGFTLGTLPAFASLEISGTTGGQVTAESFYDPNNVLFQTTTPIGSLLGPFTGFFQESTGVTLEELSNPFSLTSVVTLTGPGLTSFDALTDPAVPEPTTLTILGGGLLGLGFLAGFLKRRPSASLRA